MTNRNHRIEAIQKNAEWLANHDLDAQNFEAAKRLGLIMGDIEALRRDIGGQNE